MIEKKSRSEKIALIILSIAILAMLIYHIGYINRFNNERHNGYGNIHSGEARMELIPRDLETSSWKKRDYDLYGEKVDLTAITYDGTVYNDSEYLLSDWKLRVNITTDCFINQMWNGTLELHQKVDGEEIVDTINLASYDLNSLKFKYLYDGDLLIPLSRGDYFYYFPSEKFKENKVEKHESITIGGIFYFIDNIKMNNYIFDYHFHKTYFEGWSFYTLIALVIIWILLVFAIIVEQFAYRRAKKEMEYQNRIEHAEMESKAKSAFLANMSHEIRTPINTVIGLDTMILRETKDTEIRKYAKEIKNASSMLLSLINEILDSSKLEAGKMELVPADYSLKQLLLDVRSITKTALEIKGLDYIFDVSSTIPEKLYGDDVRLRQVIINLITNATKYTDTGNVKVTIKDELIENNKVKILFSVKDTGIGIAEEDIGRLTESYQRLDEKKNRNVEGTGLGLGLVTGLLGLMDSELKVKSVYGEGSEFYFEVYQDITDNTPIGEIDFDNMDVDENDDYEVSFIAQDANILVVDDNSMNLMVFEKLLKETKVNVTKAMSGFEALSLTEKNKYDIIFMDHMMPEMDGIETFRKIKNQQNGLNIDTPIIILTANALQGAKEEYLRIGFNDFLQKPIKPEYLENTVMVYLPKEKIQKEFNTKKNDETKKTKIDLANVQIEGVDMNYALSHLGNEEGVIEVMKNFLLMADDDANELNTYYKRVALNNNDAKILDSYRIKIHAMKTSAGLFGGLQVYGAAAFLEKAARENKIKEILVATPFFLEFWNGLKTNVENFIFTLGSNDDKKKEVDKEKLSGLLHQLETSMKTYDIKNADMIMNEIEKYNLVGKEDILRSLKLAVSKLEAEKISELCEELIK